MEACQSSLFSKMHGELLSSTAGGAAAWPAPPSKPGTYVLNLVNFHHIFLTWDVEVLRS